METFTVLPMVWPSAASNVEVWMRNSLMANCGGENATRGAFPSEKVLETPSMENSF
jgi:hypothetical protein